MFSQKYTSNKFFVALVLSLCFFNLMSQVTTLQVIDSLTHEPLIGASIRFDTGNEGTVTDAEGNASCHSLSVGKHVLTINYIGYWSKKQTITLPFSSKGLQVLLAPEADIIEEIMVSSTRSHSSVEAATQKIEVLGIEEVTEESTIKPGNIASLLGDLSVIHIQPTSQTSGANAVRMQGLGGQYTQLLRDGLPSFEGFSGNFGVLQIAPLDLRQIEILKGSNSTLYGGGAISGLINFISKKPTDKAQGSALINQSTLGESNLDGFYTSKAGRWAFSSFMGMTRQTAVDVNKDGFSDLPKTMQLEFHPSLFFNPDASLLGRVGFLGVLETREGGDIDAIKKGVTSVHPFLEKNKQRRAGIDFSIEKTFSPKNILTVKGVLSHLNQYQSVLQNRLEGIQQQSYGEIAQNLSIKAHRMVWGSTLNFSKFSPQNATSTNLKNEINFTPGIFAQDEWLFAKKISLEGGIRADHHNKFGTFILPRLALRYAPAIAWVTRLSTGMGYKIPSPLNLANLPRELDLLPIIDKITLQPERSRSLNADIQWKKTLAGDVEIHLDQAFYATQINNSLLWEAVIKTFSNSLTPIQSLGTDTYLGASWGIWELYFGYNHTETWQSINGLKRFIPFAPQDKIATTFAFDLEKKGWRGGIETARNANQYLPTGSISPNWWFWAVSITKKFHLVSLTLNGENLFDYRQSKNSALFSGTIANPNFADLYAPIDGRVFNLSIKWDWN
jgi:outer membrane receptor for ferrienterochelin and colicins